MPLKAKRYRMIIIVRDNVTWPSLPPCLRLLVTFAQGLPKIVLESSGFASYSTEKWVRSKSNGSV